MRNIKTNRITMILFTLLLLAISEAKATILWVGGEDVDFPNGSQACNSNLAGWRSGYGRIAVYSCTNGSVAKGVPFAGGGVTSAWLSAQFRYWSEAGSSKFFGFGISGTDNGIFLGISAANAYKAAIWKHDGTTWTELASASNTTFSDGPNYKLDMQIVNYGANGTVNIYVNQGASPIVTYTGDIRSSGATSFDSFYLAGGNSSGPFSELIASTTDTRLLSLVTLQPNAAGDTTQWSGAYTDIDEALTDDSDNVATATSGNNFQCNLSNLPTGNFSIQAVKVAARATKTPTGATSISLGVKTNGSISVPTAAPLLDVWGYIETFYPTNPVTSTSWTPTEINALQINIQAAP
ncbi:MAG: hypothetical protein ACXWRE_09195 [Pseudobdellovibrionaceae bacterium]